MHILFWNMCKSEDYFKFSSDLILLEQILVFNKSKILYLNK